MHFPAAGFEQLVQQENNSPRGRLMGGSMLATAPNERALLGCLLAKLAALDADVFVGHNIGAYELVVLLTRLQQHKVSVIVIAAIVLVKSSAVMCYFTACCYHSNTSLHSTSQLACEHQPQLFTAAVWLALGNRLAVNLQA